MPEAKHFSAAEVKAIGARQVRVVVSTGDLDREGDIIQPDGIDTKAYKRNPVILFNHRSYEAPIARAESIGVEGGALVATAQFPEQGVSAKSDEIYGLIKAGLINAASIGFIPTEWKFRDEDRSGWGRVFEKCEMTEFSFVSVPANANAIILERSLVSDQFESSAKVLADAVKELKESITPQAAAPDAPNETETVKGADESSTDDNRDEDVADETEEVQIRSKSRLKRIIALRRLNAPVDSGAL